MRVIGTAGHVDHGKSTLVQALTGIHPDRLKEEREREMTIDLGFAFLTLPDGEEVGIVDVPGHRDFIENMLSGIGGIDAALFVVAADEGVMPQTLEHLAILDLLHIQGGVVALTKTDMVDDPDWLDLVEEELSLTLQGTVLEEAPIVRVSARSGDGMEGLIDALSTALAGKAPRPDFGRPRLPIDRVFTIAGFGTVVTGTLTEGKLHVGDEVEIQPAGLKGRVRGLQSHNRKEETAAPGSRTAVNVSGVRLEDVPRGGWIVHPGTYPATRRVDLQFRMLAEASIPLQHNSEVKFFIGAAEVMGRARILGADSIVPGTTGWVQVELVKPVLARRGDRYILRRPSPGETIGGGAVVDPRPERRHKRFSTQVISRLEALAEGTPEDVYLTAAFGLGVSRLREMTQMSSLDEEAVEAVLEELFRKGELVALESGPILPGAVTLAAHRAVWESARSNLLSEVDSFHERFPLRRGIPREELRSRIGGAAVVFNAVLRKLVRDEELLEVRAAVARTAHTIRFSPQQQSRVDALLLKFAANPYATPSVKESAADVGDEVLSALIEKGRLVQVSPDVLFRKEDYESWLTAARAMIERDGLLRVADFRDRFRTSRKYALGFLEYLDLIGVTVREGDGRKLKG